MFAGDFSELLPATIIYDPNTGLPFPGNVIPTARLDPVSLNFLKYYNSASVLGTNKRIMMPYSEHHSVQLRLEAFNVFNHPSWGAPNANILAGAAFPGAPANAAHQGFGIISTTAIPMRQLQLGIKYLF